ncbi:Sperm associated antigen 1 [Blastocladiella emersonii ATCC 22665]|nr:Sperm associated antigen 1 [Blastocladiella emersonii ATCC 22665]
MLSPNDLQGLKELAQFTDPTKQGGAAPDEAPVRLDEYDVEHLDYGYVRTCTDVPYLTKLLLVLRSGKEGIYPELETCIENRIEELGGKVAPKIQPMRRTEVAAHQQAKASKQLDEWLSELKVAPRAPAAPRTSAKAVRVTNTLENKDDLPDTVRAEVAELDNRKGHEALRAGDFDEALGYYRRAAEMVPHEPRYRANCAVAFSKLGKHEDAAGSAQDAILLNPPGPLAYKCYLRLAVARFHQKRYADALDALAQCDRLAPELPASSTPSTDSKSSTGLDHESWSTKIKAEWRERDFEAYRKWAERGLSKKSLRVVPVTVVDEDDDEDELSPATRKAKGKGKKRVTIASI